MATVVKIGPADHGRAMTFAEFMAGDYAEGYHYELIDGKLYVSPQANAPQGLVERWIDLKLQRYADDNPHIINFVHPKTRIFVPRRRAVTAPEPDVAAYRNFPLDRPFREIRWQDVSPVLVVEVLSEGDPDKDLVRNVDLYHQVPSIKEYWVLDALEEPERPTLIVHIRYGKRWRSKRLNHGDTYTTRLLPGFALIVDPRS